MVFTHKTAEEREAQHKKKLEKKLIKAARHGNTKKLEQLLVDHSDVLTIHSSYKSFLPINVAINGSHLKTVEFLLDKGISVNPTQYSDEPPLHKASQQSAWKQRYKIVELLISRGARVNEKDEKDITPIEYATINSRRLNIISFNKRNSRKTIESLLNAGADISEEQRDNITKKYRAFRNITWQETAPGSSRYTLEGVQRQPIQLTQEDLNNALIEATRKGDNDVINTLLKQGADVHKALNSRNGTLTPEGTTLLLTYGGIAKQGTRNHIDQRHNLAIEWEETSRGSGKFYDKNALVKPGQTLADVKAAEATKAKAAKATTATPLDFGDKGPIPATGVDTVMNILAQNSKDLATLATVNKNWNSHFPTKAEQDQTWKTVVEKDIAEKSTGKGRQPGQ